MEKRVSSYFPLGYPLPKLVWYTNDEQKLIKADTTFERLDTATRNTLTIPKLTRQHFGKTYACLAANNNATEPVATNVTIDMRCKCVSEMYRLHHTPADAQHSDDYLEMMAA